MSASEFDVDTNAFGYSEKYITRRLLELGHTVRTLTKSINHSNPFGSQVEAFSCKIDNLDQLPDSLRGAAVLYNTYLGRFDHTNFSHAAAIEMQHTRLNNTSMILLGVKYHHGGSKGSEPSYLHEHRSKSCHCSRTPSVAPTDGIVPIRFQRVRWS